MTVICFFEILASTSRLGTKMKSIDYQISCNQMTCQLFKKSHRLFSERFEEGLFFACNLQYRGKIAISEVHSAINKVRKIYNPKFTQWCKTGFKIANCWKPACLPLDSLFQGNKVALHICVISEYIRYFLSKASICPKAVYRGCVL